MVGAAGLSQGIEPANLPMAGKPWLLATVPARLSSSVLRCTGWGVIKFLIEEIQHCDQHRRTAMFSTSCLEQNCPFSRSPQVFPQAPSLWISARRGKQSMSSIQREGDRKQEGPGCFSEHAVKVACPLRVAVAPSWRPESGSLRRICFLGKAGLATPACFLPHPLFRQLTSALLGRAIK